MPPVDQLPHKLLNQRFVRFLVAGGLAALCNFGSRFFYSQWVSFSIAVVLAFITGLTIGYLLNKFFVFTTSGNSTSTEIVWFVVINLLALVQTWGVSVYLAGMLTTGEESAVSSNREWSEAIAHFTGVLLPVFTSYIGHRYLTFRE